MSFGDYFYKERLQPQIDGVPIAIGFAWIGILLASFGMISRFFPATIPRWQVLLLAALFMVAFDMVMEQAAIYLDYWQWRSSSVPIQNYFTWFILGFFFIFLGEKMNVVKLITSKQLYHFYLAQLFYFLIINLKLVVFYR